ncbi:MAG: 2-amino-4-hydroxy-6-hydroxymethyldihydropteridine diphosphokinase [Lachnospiraceae bacterium]|nr:2-amino-4-hydroxy-6-hydroxymethyldihydropteridine diphosphokinase [Lachnospiraceae bacterium]
MDQIKIENLEIYAYHGVFSEEKEKGQRFYLNATLDTDLRKAGKTDDLATSTHYGEVALLLHEKMTEQSCDLIERAAEVCAEAVLLQFPLIRNITLELRKPEAPILLPFESVSVVICRGWKRAYVALGSNMGNSKAHLDGAVEALKADEKVRVLKVAEYIVTKPYGGVEQDDFVNSAMAIETLYSPEELLDRLHEIEADHNRDRIIHWGPRTLDLDILLYEDVVMDTPDLIIPHKDMHNREFVLKPMAEIAPYEKHPLLGQTMEQLLKQLA